MTKWFTADQHFGHENIIKYCNRPFKSIEEMNETIIANHNKVVNYGDDVYHLGDFAWDDGDLVIQRLKGVHHLILGNHDYTRINKFHYEDYFSSIKEQMIVRDSGRTIFCAHYAHRVWAGSYLGAPHAYGHSHGALESWGRSLDIGVDNWEFTPISYDDLWEEFNTLSYKVIGGEYLKENL